MADRLVSLSLGVALFLGLTTMSNSQEDRNPAPSQPTTTTDTTPEPESPRSEAKSSSEPAKSKTEKATFGGGCFWCMEAVFERVPGVKSVVSGYAGGRYRHPSYEVVHTGLSGHAEVVQIEFDPKTVSYERLLEIFWMAHDPTTLNQQGPDIGTQYRSIILYHNEDQKKEAQKSYEKLVRARIYSDPIVTELVPLTVFYPAEPFHQNYYRRNRLKPYCRMMIDPKIHKLEMYFQQSK